MKILTVKQPWANALRNGDKDVENRSWSTAYRGPVAIHAGQNIDENYETVWPDTVGKPAFVRSLSRGVIVGIADLVDVVTDSPSVWAEPGSFHWLFTNPRRLTVPMPYTGALGLQTLPDVAANQVLAAIEGTSP